MLDMRGVFFLWVGLILALAATTTPAAAQDADEPDVRVEEARALFERAEAQFAARQFAPAAENYQRAYDLMREAGRPTAALILFNIGRAYDRGGQTEQARAAYQQFVDEAPQDNADTRARVVTAQGRIRAFAVAATAESTGPQAATARTSASSSAQGSSSSGSGGMSPVGPIVLAGGGALVVAGLVLGGVALAQDGDVGGMCPDRTGCDPSLEGDYDSARTLATVGDVLWIAGAATAATGLILMFVLQDDGDTPTASMACTDRGCMAAVRGSF